MFHIKRKISIENNLIHEGRAILEFEEEVKCPKCHHALSPTILSSTIYKREHVTYATIVNFCHGCHSVFLSNYRPSEYMGLYSANDPVKSEPEYFERQNFPTEVETISPDFAEICNQAIAAECYDLKDIAGVGYRKALEFLVKDYLISKNPDDADTIKSKDLGKCIHDLGNPSLVTVAERAAWLGNDQTHYVKKHTDKDIEDLKKMISLTVHWIALLIGTEEAAAIERK